MKITIQGQDYTAALDAVRPLTIERKINEPSICELWLSLPANGSLAAPTRFQSIAVTGDDGTTYFTGYIAVSPLPEYAGMGLEGPRYRHRDSGGERRDSAGSVPDATKLRESAENTAGDLFTGLLSHTGRAVLSTPGNFVGYSGRSFQRRSQERAGVIALGKRPGWRERHIVHSAARLRYRRSRRWCIR